MPTGNRKLVSLLSDKNVKTSDLFKAEHRYWHGCASFVLRIPHDERECKRVHDNAMTPTALFKPEHIAHFKKVTEGHIAASFGEAAVGPVQAVQRAC